MKKSSFAALILGLTSGMLFALGMCAALLPAWDAFVPGVVLGCAGLALGLVTVLLWRRMTRKPPIRVTGKGLAITAVSVLGVLALGVGMCLCMVWAHMIPGILIGVAGIAALLCLIPLVKGLRA